MYVGLKQPRGDWERYPGSRTAGMEIQVFRNENSSQTNAYSRYSNYSYSRLIPNERALSNTIEHVLRRKFQVIIGLARCKVHLCPN